MIKKASQFKKCFANRRGSVLFATTAIIAAVGFAAVAYAFTVLYKAANNDSGPIAAYYAAQTCLTKFDRQYKPYSATFTCPDGGAIDWAASTASAVTCGEAGNADTILNVGDYCSCITKVFTSDGTTISTGSTGVCNPSRERGTADENTYSVSIEKTVSKCPTCAQLCPGGPAAPPAVCGDVACNVSCDSCCIPGAANPPCQGGICQP